MKNNNYSLLIAVAVLLAGTFFIPWKNISWGKIEMMPASTITVVGEAKTLEKTQIASFTAGVSAVNDDKNVALEEVNNKISTMINSVKNFGIPEKDIKTQNANVYQREESYYEGDRQKTRKGQWHVSNNISITLRDVDQATELSTLLTQSGATNVYGPNFTMDDTSEFSEDLLSAAVTDAKNKAKAMAAGDGQKIGKIISINEGGATSKAQPMYLAEGGGGGGFEPGSQSVSKTVTVVFELK
jgi:uncharacterized protein